MGYLWQFLMNLETYLVLSPLHTTLHATQITAVKRTLLWGWRKELEWELKNRSHESELWKIYSLCTIRVTLVQGMLLAHVNRNQTKIHFCLTKPRVTFIRDSYIWALIPTRSIIVIRGCRDWQNHALRARGYITVWFNVPQEKAASPHLAYRRWMG